MYKLNTKFSNPSQPAIYSLLLILLILPGWSDLQAQSFDHESYPKLDFNLTHLKLDLGLQPQNLNIDGAATYQLEANVSGADTVILYAARLDISSVTIDGEQADFSLHNDSLFVPVGQPSEAGDTHELYVRYSGSPTFGLLRNSKGTVWTSQLPKAQRHWVPIIDNPHETLQTTFNISVPSGYTVQASGQKTGQEAASVEVVNYHFSSEEAIPASGLSLSVGRYTSDSVRIGTKNIVLSVEEALSDSVDTQALLQSAAENLQAIENQLQLDYAFNELDIVVLEDHMWETKTWGAATIFLYTNQGDLQAQLLRGLLAQWYGVYQRETQWREADVMNLYQTLTLHGLEEDSAALAVKDTPVDTLTTVYNKFSPQRWNRWQHTFRKWSEESLKTIIADLQGNALQEVPRVLSWDDYAKYWYRQSGQPLFEVPFLSEQMKGSAVNGGADSVAYAVEYTLDEMEGQLTLTFSAQQGNYDKLITLRALEVYPNKTDTSEVTFTGDEDSVVLQVSPGINTFYLEPPSGLALRLDEYKPASFLIYELRNAESVEDRAQAARKLGNHDDNSDLQLAIRDFMNQELEPEVQASLIRSLADITKGASGTEETFLEALESRNRQIRDAALVGLQNYPDNPTVLNRVERMAHSADSMPSFKRATQVLTTLATAGEFEAFAETVIQQDTTGYRSVVAVQEMANMGAIDEATDKASLFLDSEYKYEIRSRGLQILIQHDESSAEWLNRAEALFTDTDPRIRFLYVRALEKNMNEEISDFLKENIQDEHDERVHLQIRRMIR